MTGFAYMVREDWARDLKMGEHSRAIQEWVGDGKHLVAVSRFPTKARQRTADASAMQYVSPSATRVGPVEIRDLHREVGEIVMAPVVFIHPMPGEDEEAIRELVAEHKITRALVLIWAPSDRIRLWLDSQGAQNLAGTASPPPPDGVLRQAALAIVREEYNGLGSGNGKDTAVQAIRALAREGYPLDPQAWARAVLSVGASIRSAETVMKFVTEIAHGRQHRTRPRLRDDIARVWREMAEQADTQNPEG